MHRNYLIELLKESCKNSYFYGYMDIMWKKLWYEISFLQKGSKICYNALSNLRNTLPVFNLQIETEQSE